MGMSMIHKGRWSTILSDTTFFLLLEIHVHVNGLMQFDEFSQENRVFHLMIHGVFHSNGSIQVEFRWIKIY